MPSSAPQQGRRSDAETRPARGGATGARLVVVLEAVDGEPELVIAQRSGRNTGATFAPVVAVNMVF